MGDIHLTNLFPIEALPVILNLSCMVVYIIEDGIVSDNFNTNKKTMKRSIYEKNNQSPFSPLTLNDI